jgi:hypothetical protein
MSGETEADISGWTIDTLRASVQQQILDLRSLLDERYATQTKALDAAFVAAEKGVVTALASAEKATAKAETAAERRFEAVNEFRAQLADQSATFITRVEFDAKMEGMIRQVEELKKQADRAAGRSGGQGAMYGWIIAAVGLIVSVVVMMNVLFAK